MGLAGFTVGRVLPVLLTLMMVTAVATPAGALPRQVSLSGGASQRALIGGAVGVRWPEGRLRWPTRRPRPLPFTPQLSAAWQRSEPSREVPVGMGVYGGGRLIGGWRGYRAGLGVRLDLVDQSFFAIDFSASGWWGESPTRTVRVGLTRRF